MPHARLLLQEWTVARRELRQARPARQRLRIGYSTDLPQQRLAALPGGSAAAHPDVALETLEQPAATLSRRLQMGRLDAAILRMAEIGREHVRTPVTNAHRVCRVLLGQ